MTHSYPFFLDGETERIQRMSADTSRLGQAEDAIRQLKLAALLGQRIGICDIQALDSIGLPLCFYYPEFGTFLNMLRSFRGEAEGAWLELRGRRDEAEPRTTSHTIAVVRSGLRRSQRQGWRSSASEDTTSTVSFLGWLENELSSEFEPEALIDKAVKRKYIHSRVSDGAPNAISIESYRRVGVIRAAAFFAQNATSVRDMTSTGAHTYLEVLRKGKACQSLSQEEQLLLTRLVQAVDSQIGEDDHTARRASLDGWLRTQEAAIIVPSESDRSIMWNTSVHAWNRANAESLGLSRAMFTPVHDTIELSLHTDPIEFIRLIHAPLEPTLLERLAITCTNFPDPMELPWPDMLEVIKQTEAPRRRFNEAQAGGSQKLIEGALEKLAKGIGEQLTAISIKRGIPIVRNPKFVGLLVAGAAWVDAAIIKVPVASPVVGTALLGADSAADQLRKIAKNHAVNTLIESVGTTA